MCGRYALYADRELLEAAFELAEAPDFKASYNVAPTNDIPAVTAGERGRRASLYRWGLVPFWAKEVGKYSTINARAETIASKPTFREPFRKRRCLIPASGYYEWRTLAGRKQPYYIHPGDGSLLAFAGLWDRWHSPAGETLYSTAIVVTAANADTEAIHDRMPVILDPADWDAWLAPDNQDAATLAGLLKPAPRGLLETYSVSTRVNAPRNDGPELIREAGGG